MNFITETTKCLQIYVAQCTYAIFNNYFQQKFKGDWMDQLNEERKKNVNRNFQETFQQIWATLAIFGAKTTQSNMETEEK